MSDNAGALTTVIATAAHVTELSKEYGPIASKWTEAQLQTFAAAFDSLIQASVAYRIAVQLKETDQQYRGIEGNPLLN